MAQGTGASHSVWVPFEASLKGHWKLKRAARTLGVSLVTMSGHLGWLWTWAMEYAQDGYLGRVTNVEIADESGWTGDPDVFVDALMTCGGEEQPGFLEHLDGKLHIHDWPEYGGKVLKKRELDADRHRKQRNQGRETDPSADSPQTQTDTLINEDRTSRGRHADVTRTSRATEEKNTGQKNTEENTTPENTGDALAKASGGVAAVPDAPPEDDAGIHERYLVDLKAATTQQGRVGVLIQGYTALFGKKYQANAARLAGLAGPKGMNSASELLALMFRSAPSWDGVDDPHDYLTAAVTEHLARRNGKRNGYTNGRGPPMDPKQMNDLVAATQEDSKRRVRELRD